MELFEAVVFGYKRWMAFARIAGGIPVVAFTLMAGAFAAESEAPVRLEADVAVESGKGYLRVEVTNVSHGNVVVCRDLEGGASWSVSGSVRREGNRYKGRGMTAGFISCCAGYFTEGGRLGFIRRLAADTEKAVTLVPGESHRVLIAFDGATKMLAEGGMPMEGSTATLYLRNVIVQSADADDEATMALYARRFQTPRFKFSEGAWKRDGN